MRRLPLAPLLAPLFMGLAAGLSGCASVGPPHDGYHARMEKLSTDCEARGGMLTPSGA